MRKILYIILLALPFFAPVNRVEIAKLEPIEAVAMETRDGAVILRTDTGREGRGATPADALEALKANTPAVVYLDTARFLLLSPAAADQLEGITPFLSPRVRIDPYLGGDVKGELDYLKAHLDRAKPII